jgi:hypothetical protein
MEHHPRQTQPFSFSEALKLDPTTIADGSYLTLMHTRTHDRMTDRIRNRASAEFPEAPEADAGRTSRIFRRPRVGADSARERRSHVCDQLSSAPPLLTAEIKHAVRPRKSGSICLT